MLTPEAVLQKGALLGEGSLWHWEEQVLYWVDIDGQRLHRFNPETGEDVEQLLPGRPGTVVPTQEHSLLIAVEQTILKRTADGTLTTVAEVSEPSTNRFNDGKCDPHGNFWVGTIALDKREGAANLYRLAPAGSLERVLEGVTTSNGIVWDGPTMYYIDTKLKRVDAFDYADGTIDVGSRRTVAIIGDSSISPDGMTIDENGNLWIALYRGSAVVQIDPRSGKELQRISLPVSRVTSCAFGGPTLSDLYITTARSGAEAEPLAGSLFRVRTNVAGRKCAFFRGAAVTA